MLEVKRGSQENKCEMWRYFHVHLILLGRKRIQFDAQEKEYCPIPAISRTPPKHAKIELTFFARESLSDFRIPPQPFDSRLFHTKGNLFRLELLGREANGGRGEKGEVRRNPPGLPFVGGRNEGTLPAWETEVIWRQFGSRKRKWRSVQWKKRFMPLEFRKR